MERFADSETGTGITRTRDAVRDSSTAFALLTPVRMTNGLLIVDAIFCDRRLVWRPVNNLSKERGER
jgi:hypothetical protein